MKTRNRLPVLVLASRNRGKIREIRHALDGLGFRLVGAPNLRGAPDVKETGRTIEANAWLKARALARWAGLTALADDTGLEVACLQGAPGVNSARYAGPGCRPADNIRKLLRVMKRVTGIRRRATFRCVMALARPDGRAWKVEGRCAGRIAESASGTEGFGYDPVFIPKGSRRTFSEMTVRQKDRISHRGRALRRLATWIRRQPQREGFFSDPPLGGRNPR